MCILSLSPKFRVPTNVIVCPRVCLNMLEESFVTVQPPIITALVLVMDQKILKQMQVLNLGKQTPTIKSVFNKRRKTLRTICGIIWFLDYRVCILWTISNCVFSPRGDHSPYHHEPSSPKQHNRDNKTYFSLNLSLIPSWNLKWGCNELELAAVIISFMHMKVFRYSRGVSRCHSEGLHFCRNRWKTGYGSAQGGQPGFVVFHLVHVIYT